MIGIKTYHKLNTKEPNKCKFFLKNFKIKKGNFS